MVTGRLGGSAQKGSHSQSFSFGGAAASMTTPRLPGAQYNLGPPGGPPESHGEGPTEVEGPSVLCHCGLPCNKLEAKTEKNAGRCNLAVEEPYACTIMVDC